MADPLPGRQKAAGAIFVVGVPKGMACPSAGRQKAAAAVLEGLTRVGGVIPTILLSSAIMEIVISCQLVKEVARGLAYNRLALTAK